ncbi:amphiphysin [Thalassophryne amazonica]|uniref:amphiphysin n=1 Tax=Thalassophryne amazonica TaxID=390379 RepID=UPI0014708F0E|nr:amphiphysin [Thalassophryne amazonica]
MADIKSGIFAKNVQKRINRAQEKVLQKLGKADETKDEQFEQVVINFRRQESEGSRLQREMKAYMAAIKGMQQASINLSQSLHEVYEPDWHGKDDVLTIGKDCDALWEDFHNKVVDSTLLNLDEYLLHFPDLKNRVAKRSRKLIDYDSARHHVETLQASGMKNDRKMMKAEEELKQAQKVFDELNVSLQDELPTLWDSRIDFYITVFKSVTSLEARFHREISLICKQLYEVMTKLGEQHSDKMFTIQGAPSDSGPLRLARTPSPPEDESPAETPDVSSNHMLQSISPGPPRSKSPSQLKKSPPVPPPPKVTPTKEVAEEQIIDLFGGEFLPAPSPSQPNERPGESLLDLDFDAFQPDESVSPIPQTAVPWDMWSASSQTGQSATDAGFVADWSADFGSMTVDEDVAAGPEEVQGGEQGGGHGWLPAGDTATLSQTQAIEPHTAAGDEVSSWEPNIQAEPHTDLSAVKGYSMKEGLEVSGEGGTWQEDRRQSTPGFIFSNEYGEQIEDTTDNSGDKLCRSPDGSGCEYETAEEWGNVGQSGISMNTGDKHLCEDWGVHWFDTEELQERHEAEKNYPSNKGQLSETQLEITSVDPNHLENASELADKNVFSTDLISATQTGSAFESDPFAEAQEGGAFESDPFAEAQEGGAFESDPFAEAQEGGAFESDPFVEAQEGGAFELDPFAEAQEGGTFESDPFAEAQEGGAFESDPFVEAQEGGAFESDPFVEAQEGGMFESDTFAEAQEGGAFESDPFVEAKEGGAFESDPFAEAQEGAAFESDTFAEAQEGGAFESDPFVEAKEGGAFESDPFAEAQEGGAFESDPFVEAQEGGAFESDPFAEAQEGGAFESDPFAEAQEGGAFESDPFAEAQEGGAFESDPFVEAQEGGAFELDPFAEAQEGGTFESDPFAEAQEGGAKEVRLNQILLLKQRKEVRLNQILLLKHRKELRLNQILLLKHRKEVRLNQILLLKQRKEVRLNQILLLKHRKEVRSNQILLLKHRKEVRLNQILLLKHRKEVRSNQILLLKHRKEVRSNQILLLKHRKEVRLNQILLLKHRKEVRSNQILLLKHRKEVRLNQILLSKHRKEATDAGFVADWSADFGSMTVDEDVAAGPEEVQGGEQGGGHGWLPAGDTATLSQTQAIEPHTAAGDEVINTFNGFPQDAGASSFFADFDKVDEPAEASPPSPKQVDEVQEKSSAFPAGQMEEPTVLPTAEVDEPVEMWAQGVEESQQPPVEEADTTESSDSAKEDKLSEKMPIPSVVIEPASSNEGDDDRDADIISPTTISDNGVPTENQTIKHRSASGGASALPNDYLYKVETMHDFEAANSDELELKRGDVVLVVPTASAEDQDAGWLTGIKETEWLTLGPGAQRGLFPENFTQRMV